MYYFLLVIIELFSYNWIRKNRHAYIILTLFIPYVQKMLTSQIVCIHVQTNILKRILIPEQSQSTVKSLRIHIEG